MKLSLFIGVVLVTSVQADLVPTTPFANPSGSLSLQLGSATPLYGNPNAGQIGSLNFGGMNLLTNFVRDSGFMIGNDQSTFASNGTYDSQGFGSYYTVGNVTNPGGNQLQVSGAYTGGNANISYTRTYSYVPSSLGSAADVLVETISVTNNGFGAVSGLRAWGAMNLNGANGSTATVNTTNWGGNASLAPTVATVVGDGFAMVTGTSNPNDTNFRTGFLSTMGGAQFMNFGGGSASASNITQFFGNYTSGAGSPDFLNLYAGNASASQDRASAFGYNFDLLNAGMSAQVQIFYVFSGTQTSAQQAFSAISPFAPPPAVFTNQTGVPEPSTWMMLGSALAAAVVVRRRRRSA